MTPHHRRTSAVAIGMIGLLAVACGAPSGTPTPSAVASIGLSASETASPSAEPTPTPTPEPTAEPTPVSDPSSVPLYTAGSTVETHIAGLRVHARPGTEERVVTGLLPDGADLLVALGPIFVDGYGWYLVDDADSAEPDFSRGWIASGFDPDPWLVPAAFAVGHNPYLGGFAGDGIGEYGPVHLTDANVQVEWIAAPPTSTGCSFHVDLRRGTNDAIPAIRSTIGAVVAPGILYSDYFADQPDLVGDLFVTVASDCRWALTFEELLPETEAPQPSG